MSHTLPTCPQCGASSLDVDDATCPNDWHRLVLRSFSASGAGDRDEHANAPTVDELDRVAAWVGIEPTTLLKLRDKSLDQETSVSYWTGWHDALEFRSLDQETSVSYWTGWHDALEFRSAGMSDVGDALEAISRSSGRADQGTAVSAVLRVTLAFLLLLIGMAGGWLVRDAQMPSCPTEDSCIADYRDGEWRITEATP